MKKYIQLAVGFAISAFFLWYAFKDVKLSELMESLRQTNWLYAVPMIAITLGSFFWRCFRWRIFLKPTKDVPATRLFGPLMIGFAFNNILPARAGEFLRPLALTKQEGVPYTAALSTIVLERLVDVVTLLILLATMPLYVALDPTVSETFSGITVNAGWINSNMPKLSVIAAILMLGVLSFAVPAVRDLYIRILHVLKFIPQTLREKIEGLIETFSKGFDSLRSPGAVAMTALHSAIIWLSVAFSFQLMSWGFPGVSMTFGQALAFLAVSCVVISIPSSPGFWGVYEFGGKVALLMMGVVPHTEQGGGAAVAFTMVAHFVQWLPITAIGLIYAAKLHVSGADAKKVAAT